MKKIICAAVIGFAAAFAQAATVGWSAAGMSNYVGDAYSVFVIGQNGVTDMATITELLDAGSDISAYAFGSGVVAANGTATVLPAASGKTLDAGTYTSFMVLFDAATPTSGNANYALISGVANQTRTITATTANTSFAANSVANLVNNASNWKSFGSAGPAVPEPTSGLLLLLGMAGLALKRKVA